MKKSELKLMILLLLFVSVSKVNAQELTPELKVLKKIANTEWVGRFDDPEETQQINLRIEIILDGVCLLETKQVPAANNFISQTHYYWDPEAKSIAYLSLTNNRYITRGFITIKDSLIFFHGTQYDPGGSPMETTGERILKKNGTMIEKAGHTIIYRTKQNE